MSEMGIKEEALRILEILKSGEGTKILYNRNMLKIIGLVKNECKSTITLEDGTEKKYESDLSIYTVRDIIMEIISDRNSIDSLVASRLMSTPKVRGIFREIPIEKVNDTEGNLHLLYKKPFPDNFNKIIQETISDRNVIEKIFIPRAISIIENDNELSKQNRLSKLMHPIKTKQISNEELKKRYATFLKREYSLPENHIENMVDYFVMNFLNSEQIEKEVIDIEKRGGFILPKNKAKKGYLGMIENIASNLVDSATILKNPNDKIEEIKDIYGNLVGQLSALGISLNGNPQQIEEKIKEINRNLNRDRRLYNSETGYRDVEVTFGKEDVGLLRERYVPKAMRLFAESIQEFQEKKEGMDDKEFIKEIAKLHFRFIRIHPFPDGNGRTGRAIVNSLLSERNLCAVLEKDNKREYINIMDAPTKYMGEEKYIEYYKALYMDQEIASEIEDKYISKIEEFFGIKCLKREDLYNPRNDADDTIEIFKNPEQEVENEPDIQNATIKDEGILGKIREKIGRIFKERKAPKMLGTGKKENGNANSTRELSEEEKNFIKYLSSLDNFNKNISDNNTVYQKEVGSNRSNNQNTR